MDRGWLGRLPTDRRNGWRNPGTDDGTQQDEEGGPHGAYELSDVGHCHGLPGAAIAGMTASP
jgi:hypothetical protein